MSTFLRPLSWLYTWGVNRRNRRYDLGQKPIYRPPVPTLSIGNISVGGTGKTPFAEYVIRYYLGEGRKVAYLSRGYGRKSRGFFRVNPETGDSRTYGDEALQVASKFPEIYTAVCEDRRIGIMRLLADYPAEVIVLDDAFQHRKVARQADIVMIDANRLPYHDLPLPAGKLREPLPGLHRADLLVINKLNDPQALLGIRQALKPYQKPVAACTPAMRPIQPFFDPPAHNIPEKVAVLFSGIGNPGFLLEQISGALGPIGNSLAFRDHHRYRPQDLRKIASQYQILCEKSPRFEDGMILTTEKDYYRLKGQEWIAQFEHLPLYYVPITLKWWQGEAEVQELLDRVLKA